MRWVNVSFVTVFYVCVEKQWEGKWRNMKRERELFCWFQLFSTCASDMLAVAKLNSQRSEWVLSLYDPYYSTIACLYNAALIIKNERLHFAQSLLLLCGTSESMAGYLRPLLFPKHLVLPPSNSWHQKPFWGSNLSTDTELFTILETSFLKKHIHWNIYCAYCCYFFRTLSKGENLENSRMCVPSHTNSGLTDRCLL